MHLPNRWPKAKPSWQQRLAAYWLRKTAYLRHSEPFNKRNRERRAERKFKESQRNDYCIL
jgi:hypothetical protein